MDKLDKITSGALVLLITAVLILIIRHQPDPQAAIQTGRNQLQTKVGNLTLAPKIKTAKTLLLTNNLAQAEELINLLVQDFPYESEPHMALADLHMRRQNPVPAMLEYRKAIDLNPDYLDKKTPLFQGKKIKNNVNEAKKIIFSGLRKEPGSKELKTFRKTLYYMLRRIAGSCG